MCLMFKRLKTQEVCIWDAELVRTIDNYLSDVVMPNRRSTKRCALLNRQANIAVR